MCGGGAKGAAHVGVLKVLEENNIPIDYIVGTSMGAIVGGLYAIGYSADELDSLIMSQDWSIVMSDKVPREDISFEQKRYDEKFLLTIPFGIGAIGRQDTEFVPNYNRNSKKGKRRKKPIENIAPRDTFNIEQQQSAGSILSRIPMALVTGQNIFNLFTRLSVGYQDSLDFNRMPIPFACVAVDLVSKKEVVFHSGNFVQAIRSSMAIPGYFAPVELNGMVLVDGGVKNNYPVDVAKDMGADIIIGVKLGEEDKASRENTNISNIGDMLNEMLSLYMEEKYANALSMTDLLIAPSVKGFSTMSFDLESLRQLIDNGTKAALEKDTELKRLKSRLDEAKYEEEISLIGPKYIRKPYKKAIHIDQDTVTLGSVINYGLSLRDAEWLFRNSKLKTGARVTGKDIDEAISEFYNTDAFASVTYLLRGQESPYDMEITFVPGRTSRLGVGLRFDSEEVASILLDVSFNNRALYGSKFAFTADLAYNTKLRAKYSYAFKTLVQFNTSVSMKSTDLNIFDNALRSNDIVLTKYSYDISLSSRKFKSIYTELGMRLDAFNYKSDLTKSSAPDIYDPDATRNHFISAFANIQIDALDKETFPTRGFSFKAGYSQYFNWLNSEKLPFGALNANITWVMPISKRFAFIPSIYNRTLLGGNIPVAFMNIMGGYEAGRYMDHQIPFYGFGYSFAFKNILTVASIDARYRVAQNHYIFATASYALDHVGISDILVEPGVLGARLGYSYDSVIGPISFNLHWSDYTRKVGAYLSIGYRF